MVLVKRFNELRNHECLDVADARNCRDSLSHKPNEVGIHRQDNLSKEVIRASCDSNEQISSILVSSFPMERRRERSTERATKAVK